MFTGIIGATQPVTTIVESEGNTTFTITKPADWTLAVGESVSIDGVCSTVLTKAQDSFDVEYIPETLRLTTLGDRTSGDRLNLERSITLNDVLSGHMVAGHVDATGTLAAIAKDGGSYRLTITHHNPQYVISKGSIAVNGISLTVIDPTDDAFTVAIIPHTWEQTNLSQLQEGSRVNLEYDMIAKYIERIQNYG